MQTHHPNDLRQELTDYIERMSPYQLRLVLSFIKTLFNLHG